jgi:glycine dehydrogenase subunit 1
MPYIPHTDDEVKEMLAAIGASSIEALFDEIPHALCAAPLKAVPEQASEWEVTRLLTERAAQDAGALCFLGAGAYEHHIPAPVWEIATRGEFYSAYTPYQAEASQGTLQLLYEYQSMMASLTALDVSNASLYDGASALAEAVLMAVRANRKSSSKRILMPRTVHPLYRRVVEAVVRHQGIELAPLDYDRKSGAIDPRSLPTAPDDFAALVIPMPNFFGVIEDVDTLTDWAHKHGALVVGVVNPIALAVLAPPGAWGEKGADIACGEGQPLGVPLASGGPYFGFMCCRQDHVRQMPGRIIGRTVDVDGREGFVLTLQAREQHIRRSKATSNICTNQGLMVTAATIYMSLLGAQGLAQVARHSHGNTRALIQSATACGGVENLFDGAFFHESVLRLPRCAADVLQGMLAQGVIAGLDLSGDYPELGDRCVLVCATETKSRADIDRYTAALQNALRV